VRGTQDPSERLPQKVCEKRVQGLGWDGYKTVGWVQTNARDRQTDRPTKWAS
jgi:hypothetical protein